MREIQGPAVLQASAKRPRGALLLEASYFRQFSPLLSSDGVSLTDTVALLNLTSRIITRKVHIEKILYRGEFSGVYWKYDICSVFFADRDNFFVH